MKTVLKWLLKIIVVALPFYFFIVGAAALFLPDHNPWLFALCIAGMLVGMYAIIIASTIGICYLLEQIDDL